MKSTYLIKDGDGEMITIESFETYRIGDIGRFDDMFHGADGEVVDILEIGDTYNS